MNHHTPTRTTRHPHTAGFTLTELLIAMGIVSILILVAFGLYNGTASLINTDRGRVNTNQNLRTSLDTITQDLREAGESLSAQYTVSGVDFDPVNGLTIRKGLNLPVLSVCQTFNGTPTSILVTGKPSDTGTVPAQCTYSDAGGPTALNVPNGITDKLDPWVTYITTSGQASIPAFLYNPATRAITRIVVSGITNTATTATLTVRPYVNTSAFSWTSASVIVPVDERRYYLVGDELRFIANEDPATVQSLGYGATALNFKATTVTYVGLTPTTTTYNTFSVNSPWKAVTRIDLTLSGSNVIAGTKAVARQFDVSVYPRNVIQAK